MRAGSDVCAVSQTPDSQVRGRFFLGGANHRPRHLHPYRRIEGQRDEEQVKARVGQVRELLHLVPERHVPRENVAGKHNGQEHEEVDQIHRGP